MPINKLLNKTVLITGSAVRIGREIALAFAKHGANLIIHYNKSRLKAEELQSELLKKDIKAWTIQADLRESRQIDRFINECLEKAGSLDILVNNASVFPKISLNDLTLTDLMTDMEINTWAPFALSRAFAGQVKSGSIINMLDQRITSYNWTHSGYILSKHVLAVLTRMCALAFAPSIRVNGIAPGLILPPPGEPMSYIENLSGTVPLKRHGNPSDVAKAAIFLAECDYITGDVIFIDGGQHLKEYAA
jgi:pteridine reductase